MALSKDLLEIICCPETRQPLTLVASNIVDGFNEKITRGAITTRGQKSLDQRVSDLLLRQDGLVAYQVRNDIPILLVEEALDASLLKSE